MTLRASTLRPGLLVSLKTSLTGNVKYFSEDIERDHVTEDGSRKAKWVTERIVRDPEEHEAARRVQSKARSLVRSVCAWSSNFGLLCPEAAANELDQALVQARALAEQFNSTARLSRVGVYIMVGRIAPDDVEAVRSINSEVRELMAEMTEGVKNLDVERIRAAATSAKSIGQMLTPDAAAKIQVAIDAARGAAKKIVKAGEVASAEIDSFAIRRITEARTQFLDLDEVGAVSAPDVQGRAIEFEPEPSERKMMASSAAPQIALEF